MGSFLELIEAAFTPVLAPYEFEPARLEHSVPPAFADIARYVCGRRSVTICYSPSREQWCEVSIDGYGEPQPVVDLMYFVRGLEQSGEGYRSSHDPDAFASEAQRCCALLVEYCGEFLDGEVVAFRKRYRELLLVGCIREARYNAEARNDPEEMKRYDRWLRDYRLALPGNALDR